MTEPKKGFRIAAGILLLLLACITLASYVSSLSALMKTDYAVADFRTWISAAGQLPAVIAAILILARKFTGAGVMRALILASSIAGWGVFFFILVRQTGMPDAETLFAVLPSLLILLVRLISEVLIVVALFLHSRRSKGLLIAAAILSLSDTLLSAMQTAIQMANAGGGAKAMISYLGIHQIIALIPFIAWLLLAFYFGAQENAEA